MASTSIRSVEAQRFRGPTQPASGCDEVAVEEPLEIRTMPERIVP